MRGKKAAVFVSVTCGVCGDLIGKYYKNSMTISTIKEKTKDWIYHPKHGNICPKCQKLMSQQKIRRCVH